SLHVPDSGSPVLSPLSLTTLSLISISPPSLLFFFFFNDPAPTEIYTLSLHDALPISRALIGSVPKILPRSTSSAPSRSCCAARRSEEHTSELQSLTNLVCRLLLEKKKKTL